ncbi:MAG: type III pantothenate kinase [Pirellulales bacterium]|nr:type III pantothenate kinase [Pirellulales bacterium]
MNYLCIDVGNSRIKLGMFSSDGSGLPEATIAASSKLTELETIDGWLKKCLAASEPLAAFVASVSNPSSEKLLDYLTERGVGDVRQLCWQDFGLEVGVEQPSSVGVDRLAAALAAQQLSDAERAAIVVDFGSAITVDRVSADGTFEGGAILPGVEMAASALHRQTDALPHIQLRDLQVEPALPGRSTSDAIAAGVYWGAVGAAREMIEQLAFGHEPEPHLVVTGGWAEPLAPLVGETAIYEPHLVLQGIAHTARRISAEL